MCDHGHNGHGCCDHGDATQLTNPDELYSLFQKIDIHNVECLNEVTDGSGVKVFKPWSERLNREDFVESDCDAELLFNIPFTGDIKLMGIIVIGDEELHKVRMFNSKLRMNFDNTSAEADQEIELAHDPTGVIEHMVKPQRFSNLAHLTLHFQNRNVSDDSNPCRIYYIGLRGQFTQANRDGIVIANYEIRPTATSGEPEVNSHLVQ